MSRTPPAASSAMRRGIPISLDLDVHDAPDGHEADEHEHAAHEEQDDAEGMPATEGSWNMGSMKPGAMTVRMAMRPMGRPATT